MWDLKVSTFISASQITTSKISHCLLQPQIINPWNFPSYPRVVSRCTWCHVRRSRTHHPSSFSWLTPETKRYSPCPPSLNETRNKKMQFQPTLTKALCSTPLTLTHRRLKHSKTQKWKKKISASLPIDF